MKKRSLKIMESLGKKWKSIYILKMYGYKNLNPLFVKYFTL